MTEIIYSALIIEMDLLCGDLYRIKTVSKHSFHAFWVDKESWVVI